MGKRHLMSKSYFTKEYDKQALEKMPNHDQLAGKCKLKPHGDIYQQNG